MGKKNTEIKVVPLRQPTKMISTRLPQYLIDYVDEIRDVKRLGPKAIGRSEQIRNILIAFKMMMQTTLGDYMEAAATDNPLQTLIEKAGEAERGDGTLPNGRPKATPTDSDSPGTTQPERSPTESKSKDDTGSC